MSSTAAPPDKAATKPSPAAAPLHGYYAVRKGKHGLRDCIFVSWDRAKEFVDTESSDGKDDDGSSPPQIEFSFFAKVEDAIQYLHPNSSNNKSYAELCSNNNSKKEDSNPKEPNKRKRLAVLGRPLKKIRIPTHGKASDDAEMQDADKKEGKATENEAMSDASPDEESNKDPAAAEGTVSSAPLNVLLEQAFQQNLPKGWRSQSLGLYLTRRDHFREPALKQYLKDLVDLQNYREQKQVQGRAGGHTEIGYRHFSGASHPLSVYYLNWSWGVCNSYHRDIRRQQKNRPPMSTSSELDGVELPHFKAHTTKSPDADAAATGDDDNGNSDDNNTTTSADQSAVVTTGEPTTKPPSTTSSLTPASGLPYALEQAYLGSRDRGWRAREFCATMKKDSDEPKPTTVGDEPKHATTSEKPAATVGEEPKPATIGNEKEPAGKSQDKGEPKSSTDDGNTGDNVGETVGEEKTDNVSNDAKAENEPPKSDNKSNEENAEHSKADSPDKISEPKADNGTVGGTTEENNKEGQPDNGATPVDASKNDDSGVDDDLLEIQFQKDFKELLAFRDAHPEEIQRYRGTGHQKQHPSGTPSPFAIRYLKWAWGKEVDDNDSGDQKVGAAESSTAGSNKRKGPSLPLRTKPAEAAAAAAAAQQQTNPVAVASASAPSEPTPVAVASTENDGEHPTDGSDDEVEDDTPPLIEALRASWFAAKDKGWRADELGFPQGGNNRKYNTTSRKERERLYLIDLEVLKKWWKTYPSSQHYVFTVPDEDGNIESEGIDRSKFPYGRSGKNNMTKFDQRHKSGINAPWSLTYLNWSWGVSNSYNRDLTRKEKRKAKADNQQALYI